MKRQVTLPPNLPPRGLSREEAAEYLGISVSKLDEGVAAGAIPAPETGGPFGRRKVFDRMKLDRVFDEGAPTNEANEWDDAR